MRVGGRVRSTAMAPLVAYLLASVQYVTSNEYGIPIEIKLWDTGRTPLAHMVDVTNGFGLKVLAEHNFLNDNNIAFSPYGLMGILVALYEGVDGESSYQIQRGMQLPWNRNVMRIGFRDIHRTLKTYFVPEEGFLAGLALNNENVTFNEGYKKILRFYGFDLDNDQLPTIAPTNSTNATTTTASEAPTEAPTEATTAMPTDSMPAREETTPNPNAETISTIISSTTANPSSASSAESTSNLPTTVQSSSTETNVVTVSTLQQTLAPETTTLAPETTTVTPEQTTAVVTETTTTAQVVTNAETTGTVSTTNAETIAFSLPPSPTAALTEEPTVNNEVEIITTPDTSNTAGSSTLTDSSVPTVESSTPEMTTATEMSITPTTELTEAVTSTTTTPTTELNPTTLNESTLETLERKKKSIVDFIFTNPPYVDDYLVYRSYDIPLPGTGFDNNMFLANGLKSVQVSYMHYNTVLEHAFLPHLEACALRLPLDSERYYLLVVLPNRAGIAELGRLLSRMARESDLSDVYAALRPKRVRAIVPSFTVKGHVTLTTDLQKLGIRDVFEPRQHDFSPMTHQAGVYVRSIEQAVSVAIRKYQPDDNKNNRYVTNRQPVTFSATYPFLYFVMDSSIHVALMAGKMVDTLNSRIL